MSEASQCTRSGRVGAITRISSAWSKRSRTLSERASGLSAAAPAATRRRVATLSLSPVSHGLGVAQPAEDLVDRSEVDLEAVAGGAQIEPPDAQPLGAGQLLGPLDVLVEVADPVAERLGVIGAELLDVPADESCALQRQHHARDMGRLPVGEDVALGERTALDVPVLRPRDAVVEQPAAGFQHRGELVGVDIDLRLADVLDHPDRRDRVEVLAGELAVVLDADLDLVGDTRLLHLLARELSLVLGQRDPYRFDAVALRRVDDEAAPAAADVENALAGAQFELCTDELPLGVLGRGEALRAAGEDRAGVGHRLIEEEREELVADVVVVADGFAVALGRVLAAAEVHLGLGRGRGTANARGAQGRGDQAGLRRSAHRWRLPRVEHADHTVDVVDLDLTGDVGAPEAELAGG